MRTVWKYRIPYWEQTEATFDIPVGGTIVHIAREKTGSVEDFVSLWVEVNSTAATEARSFVIVGTGHPIPVGSRYRGTAFSSPLVIHLYEQTSPSTDTDRSTE